MMSDENNEAYKKPFSECKLVISMDGNELSIPLNFGMTDEEVRKIYPYLLNISAPVNNPMIEFDDFRKTERFQSLSEEEQRDCAKRYENMAKYWYDKPSTSLLDVGVGLAIDIKLNGMTLNDFGNIPDNTYSNNINSDKYTFGDITADEVKKIEEKYNVKLDSEVESTLTNNEKSRSDIAGNLDVDMYQTEGIDDFFSKELDSMDTDLIVDNFSKIIEDEANEINSQDSNRYAMSYKGGSGLDDAQLQEYRDKYGVDLYGSGTDDESVEESAEEPYNAFDDDADEQRDREEEWADELEPGDIRF